MVRPEVKNGNTAHPILCICEHRRKKRNDIFEVHGVVRYLFWLGKPAIVKDEEILVLRESLKETMVSVEIDYKTGETISIPEGPF